MQILKPQAAVADFRKVLALEPKNETVRAQLVATQKLIRKIEFERVRIYYNVELKTTNDTVPRPSSERKRRALSCAVWR
jgi:hypothetical protein